MAKIKHEPVTFKNSLGETISNDPVFLAQRTLAQYGSGTDDSNDALDTSPYADLNGKELKALAAQRGVDITGLKTVGQVRDALTAADEAAAKSDDTDDDTDGDE